MSLLCVYFPMAIHIAHWYVAGRTLAPPEMNEVLYTLELGIVAAGLILMSLAVVSTALCGRFFRSWGCHILELQDLCAWLLSRARIRPRPVRSRILLLVPVPAMGALHPPALSLRLATAYCWIEDPRHAVPHVRDWLAAHPEDHAWRLMLAAMLISRNEPCEAESLIMQVLAAPIDGPIDAPSQLRQAAHAVLSDVRMAASAPHSPAA